MAGLYAPLPTLRRRPRGRLRTDRGRRGLLLLHRSGLSPHTPRQSPGALTRVAACTLARSRLRDPLWCRRDLCWNLIGGLRSDEDTWSGSKVNRVIGEFLGEALPSVHFAHNDLT